MRKVVLAVVSTEERAEALAQRFTSVGFDAGDVSVLLPDARRAKAFVHELHTRAPEGAIAGVVSGGIVGCLLGLIGGTGFLAVPWLAPLVAAGTVMASLSGAAVFAAIFGVVGAIRGGTTPRYEARMYEGRLRDGNLLFSVYTETYDQQRLALETLRAFGARDVSIQGELAIRPRLDDLAPVALRSPRSNASSPSP